MKQFFRRIFYKLGYKDSFLQKLYISLMSSKAEAQKEEAAKKVNTIGDDILNIVVSVSKEQSVLIWPEFGTLLGAYRDKSFISFDTDIDLGILTTDFSDEVMNAFIDRGCKKVRQLHLASVQSEEKKLLETTLEYNGLNFDLFLSDRIGDKQRKVYISYQKLDEIKSTYKCKYYTVDFAPNDACEVFINDIRLLYPANPEIYLKAIYGETFMVPIKGWIPPKVNPILTYMDSKKYFVQETKY